MRNTASLFSPTIQIWDMWQAYQAGGWYGVGNVKGGRVADAALMVGTAGAGKVIGVGFRYASRGISRGVTEIRLSNAGRKWGTTRKYPTRRGNMLEHFYRDERGIARGIRMGYRNPMQYTRAARQFYRANRNSRVFQQSSGNFRIDGVFRGKKFRGFFTPRGRIMTFFRRDG